MTTIRRASPPAFAATLLLLAVSSGCQRARARPAEAPPREPAPGHQTAHLIIEAMASPACPVLVRKALEKVDGVRQIDATWENHSVRVSFDPARTSVATIQSTIKDRVGFDSRLERVEKRNRLLSAEEDCGCHQDPEGQAPR